MAGRSLSQADLIACTEYVAKMLQNHCEYFLFFGSLLGYVRDGTPIDGDDDVDMYVDKKNSDVVRRLLKKHRFEVLLDGRAGDEDFFIQSYKYHNGKHLKADFYFYNSNDPLYLIDRWNFHAAPENPARAMKIPKPLIFPLQSTTYCNSQVYIPRYPEIICEFLYGLNWRRRMNKKTDYKNYVVGGKPLLIKTINKKNRIIP